MTDETTNRGKGDRQRRRAERLAEIGNEQALSLVKTAKEIISADTLPDDLGTCDDCGSVFWRGPRGAWKTCPHETHCARRVKWFIRAQAEKKRRDAAFSRAENERRPTKRHLALDATRVEGTIHRHLGDLEYAFVRRDDVDYFFHCDDVLGGLFHCLKPGERVSFVPPHRDATERDRTHARRVRAIATTTPPPSEDERVRVAPGVFLTPFSAPGAENFNQTKNKEEQP